MSGWYESRFKDFTIKKLICDAKDKDLGKSFFLLNESVNQMKLEQIIKIARDQIIDTKQVRFSKDFKICQSGWLSRLTDKFCSTISDWEIRGLNLGSDQPGG